jgi:predicted O-methyltransferase YrrM
VTSRRTLTAVLIAHENEQRALERLTRDLLPSLAHSSERVDSEVVVFDNSRTRLERLACQVEGLGAVPAAYRWNDGRNLYYGPTLNLAVASSDREFLLYVCANHGRMHHPGWIDDLLAPFVADDGRLAMAGSYYPSGRPSGLGFPDSLPHVHVQGGVFLARRSVLATHRYPADRLAHWGSDVYESYALMQAGYRLVDVPTVKSVWRRSAEPGDWKYVHDDAPEAGGADAAWRRWADSGGSEAMPISSRTDVLNYLVASRGFERYLELGVEGGESFSQVIAPFRHGVDPNGAATFAMTSDEFFERGLGFPSYELVFIDALHEEQACLRDIEHALERLAPGGCIVVHDANPPTEWHQRPASEYKPGTAWNGTVWKAVVRFRERHPDIAVTTLDLDWGCAVIWPGPAVAPPPAVPDDLRWADLESRRAELLNLVPATWEELGRLGQAP